MRNKSIFFLGLLSGIILVPAVMGSGYLLTRLTNRIIDKIDPSVNQDRHRFAALEKGFNLSFEAADDLKIFDVNNAGAEISGAYATAGEKSLLVEFPPNVEYPGLSFDVYGKQCMDWSGMKEFSFDIFNTINSPAAIIVQIRSGKEYPKKTFKKEFRLSALERATLTITGEELAGQLDLKLISHLTIFMNGNLTTFRVYLDNMKVIKDENAHSDIIIS